MKKIIALLLLLLITGNAEAAKFIELRILCCIGGPVRAVMPDGETITLGRVLITPTMLNPNAYTASKWASPATVCASAVNAVHVLVNVSGDRGRIFSLIPSVTVAPAVRSRTSFIMDMEAGTGIFGGFAPLTGSKVNLIRDGQALPLEDIPRYGDLLVIRTELPDKTGVYMVDFENRPGGRVIAHTRDEVKVIARVVRKVSGVGRFAGTMYQSTGKIRASHSGVIDISTSKFGEIGGIQIIPLNHALTSRELSYVWRFSQYMILSPLPGQPNLEGKPPLFSGELMPSPQSGDKSYRQTPLVFCRRNSQEWEQLPEFSGRVDDAMKDITHLRIYFPVWRDYPEMNK